MINQLNNPFELKVQSIETKYRNGFPQGNILLFGSSFMEEWKTSAEDLVPLDTINVGIGGTRVSDWASFYHRIIVPFHPKAMLAYIGSNDVSGDETSKTGEQVYRELLDLFELLNEAIPGVPIHYISIAPTLARWHVWQDSNRANTLVRDFCNAHPGQYSFIDCTDALLTTQGLPMPDIFLEDQLHFNPQGYRIWQSVIQPHLLTKMIN